MPPPFLFSFQLIQVWHYVCVSLFPSTSRCIDLLLPSYHLQFRSPFKKQKPPNYRGIVRSDVLVCFLGLLLGIGLFLHKMVLHFRVYWSAVFNLPLPVPSALCSEGSRTVVVLSFRVSWSVFSNLSLPVPFAFYSDGSRTVVVLSGYELRIFTPPLPVPRASLMKIAELSWYRTFRIV